jgi:hypothetical protein
MPTNEKINLNYLHQTTYSNTPDNQVGTDADQNTIFGTGNLQRTVPTPTGDIAYVRKFGLAHSITDLSSISDPGVANLTWTVKTADGATTYGSRANGGAYSDGSTTGTATAIRLEASVSGATTVLPTTMSVVDTLVGTLTVNLPAESVTSVSAQVFYIARSGSSYYDSSLKYGGARHTPVLTSSAFPYFDIATAYGALAASNNDAVQILDSETYDEDLTTDNQAFDSADTIVYAKSGVTPTITRGVGARTTREVSAVFNNANAVFFNENGSNTDTGAGGYEDTWQDPYGTIANALTAAGNKSVSYVIYGGTGAGGTGKFTENNLTLGAWTMEPEYGYMPQLTSTGNFVFNSITTATSPFVKGFVVDDCSRFLSIVNVLGAEHRFVEIHDCTIQNCTTWAIYIDDTISLWFYRCVVHGALTGFYYLYNDNAATTPTLQLHMHNNILYNMPIGFQTVNNPAAANTSVSGNIINNTFRDFSDAVFKFQSDVAQTMNIPAVIDHNTFYDVNVAFEWNEIAGTLNATGSYDNNIFHTIGDYAITNDTGSTITINYCNFYTWVNGKWDNNVTSNNEISGDPKLCKITSPFKLGISADSPCYRAAESSEDGGARFRLIEIDAVDIIINGIKIDGNVQFFNAVFIRDSANHTGLNVKWCNVVDFNGIAIDLYDDGTNLDAVISNNLIGENGNGARLAYGGNTLEENCIYNSSVFGIHVNYNVNTFNHNVFYGGQYGVYLESSSNGNTFKNNITNNNSLYGIFSETSLVITYCCITDAVNANVDKTSTTNNTNNPLFINTDSGSENFNIKTTEGGYSYNSSCKDAAESSTFPDIGAYDITRAVINDYWQKHTFAYNPRVLDYQINSKGNTTFNSGTGTQWNWSKGRRRGFQLKWQTGQYSDETDRLKVEFLNSLYQRADKERLNEEVKVRFNPLPSQQIESGTAATVSATGKTITETGTGWVEDEHKGYHVGIKFDSDSANGTITAATKKLLVAPSPAWTNDEWIGYYFPYNGYYYYITDNDADELTLSDPDGTLSNVSNIDWTIEKYFKITENTATVLTVEDDNSELVAGSYDWIIRFIECHVLSPNMKYKQPRYYWQKETWKTGYSMYLEEI